MVGRKGRSVELKLDGRSMDIVGVHTKNIRGMSNVVYRYIAYEYITRRVVT